MLQVLSVSSSSLDFSNSNYNYDNANANVSFHLCNNSSVNRANMAKNNNTYKSTGTTYGNVIFLKQRA
jgi:hypothetical protein